ncbi:MAG: hypothetical protein COV31_03135 [Candidatus Yanofskybacteria bacterium CG10_big_fil_rev_8_21_14_0_10_46_23]|uniref:ASPIC/UnbV domain-containing protein n=1 Tax=Candidatus Yanofskybacteria bacterium CG10_big_fil_rev_8_21_14_0_10_46_23 TaxID=1975098 RepID=A0A2H0R3S5_9BACT|nr:MAG: hypothetical protein COV31_03135 [Candidatus Yanofskybacteria bacterium CG10_big_fil_rev_8_21_14_0_10_46_23]
MKKIIILLLAVAFLAIVYYFAAPYLFQPKSIHSEVESSSVSTPTFTEIGLDFVHNYDKDDYAFAGSALIDIDGDGREEVFIGGGINQIDGLFRFENDRFVNIASQAGFTNENSSAGALSIDFDNDGDADLLVARLDGVYLYTNNQGQFAEQKLGITLEKDAVPMSLSATDLNKDGLIDLYVATFKSPKVFKLTTFNDPANRSKNIMLLNKGGNQFEDITEKSGLAYNQNTFQASFVDLNNDTWPDLVLAPNTDKVVVYENKKNGTFESKPALTDFGFWMGLAVGDIDADGDQDLFFSNIGNTIPITAARGDLRPDQILDSQWRLLRNDGNFQFTDITTERALDDYEFGWGALFEDLNLDGRLDLLVSENYVKWPAHKINKLNGRVFLQESDQTFLPITQVAGLNNPYYGTTPLLADFNQDGYPDVVFINFNGPSKAYLNSGGPSNFLKVFLPDIPKSLGARVDVERLNGSVSSKQVIGVMGLLTDVSSELVFGLGQDSGVRKVTVTWASGQTRVFNDVQANTRLAVD